MTIEEISKAITELKLNKARHGRMASEWTYGNGFFQKKKNQARRAGDILFEKNPGIDKLVTLA